jgi:hypothetical protein
VVAEVEQHIITGQAAVLRPLLDILEADPETAVVSVHLNSQAEPDRLVVVMAQNRADALGAALSPLVGIFHNDPLPGPEPPLPNPNLPLPDPNGRLPDPDTMPNPEEAP